MLLTSDATIHGAAGRGLVEELSARARYVIGLKAGESGGGVVTSRSGRGSYRLMTILPKKRQVTGGAVLAHLHRSVKAIEELSDEAVGLRVALRRLELDTPFDRAPENAEAVISLRFNRLEDGQRIEEEIRSLAKKRSSQGLRLRLLGQIQRPPLVATPTREAFYEMVAEVGKRLHVAVKPLHRWNSSDICFVPEGVPAIDGMGPIGGGEGTQDEYILRSSLVERAALLAMTMHRCSKSDK